MSTAEPNLSPKHTNGFYFQAVVAFGLSLAAMLFATIYLDLDGWVRGFVAVNTLFLVSSTITLAKVVRDREESASILSRVDQVRLERLLAEYDPLRQSMPPSMTTPSPMVVGQPR